MVGDRRGVGIERGEDGCMKITIVAWMDEFKEVCESQGCNVGQFDNLRWFGVVGAGVDIVEITGVPVQEGCVHEEGFLAWTNEDSDGCRVGVSVACKFRLWDRLMEEGRTYVNFGMYGVTAAAGGLDEGWVEPAGGGSDES